MRIWIANSSFFSPSLILLSPPAEMESLGSLYRCSHLFRPSLLPGLPSLRNSVPSRTPPLSSSLKLSAVRASSFDKLHQNNPRNPRPVNTLTPILKSACITFSAALALFLFRFQHKPSMAAPVPSSQVEPESSTSNEEQGKKPADEQLLEQADDVTLLLSQMDIKIKEKKLQEAIQILNRLIELEPEEDEYPILKASLYNYNGDFELAKEAFEQILEKDPLCVEAYHGLVVASSESEERLNGVMNRVKAAMRVCRLENMDTEVRDFKLLIAQMEAVEGNYGDALKIHDELVKEEPGDFRPYLCQGIIYTLQGKNDEAEEKFRRYRQLIPENHPHADFFDEKALLTNLLQSRN